MNVTDITTELNDIKERMDMLETIFSHQKKTAERFKEVERRNGVYYPDSISIDSPMDQEFLKRLGGRIQQELSEAMECLKNKAWKQTHVNTDVEHMKEELADALHFFIELCLCLGMNAEELFSYYLRKNKVNDWRIDTKY